MEMKHSFAKRLRYRFDNMLASGTSAVVAGLGIISALVVILFGSVYVFSGLNKPGSEGMGFAEALWQALMRSLDAGTVAGDDGWGFRLVGFLITLGGIFILSILIGILTSGIQTKLEELRKGRSEVIESNHTLILGWSPKVFHIISELVLANENQRNPRIVILAPVDKAQMDDEIRSRVPDTGNTRVICRSGNPLDLADLEIVNPNQAKSVIILSPPDDITDIYTIKSVLALTNNPRRKAEKYHIVAELSDPENLEVGKLVGNDEVVYVLTSDLTSRITAQTSRQSGLSIIYTELLDYGGDEIYFKHESVFTGKKVCEALPLYEHSSIIGLMQADGTVHINPPMDRLIEEGDQMIVVAADDDAIHISDNLNPVVQADCIVEGVGEAKEVEMNLILGWNNRGRIIVSELDNYVKPGSGLLIVSEYEQLASELADEFSAYTNQKISFVTADIVKRKTFDDIDVARFQSVIILSYSHLPVQEADAKTLVALLHLRNISEQTGRDFNIVSEMLDLRNRELAEVTRADDFIVSDRLVSLVLTQFSENKHLKEVFDVLFKADGSEIYLKPVELYVKTGVPLTFYTVVEAAARKGQIALGYRLMEYDHDSARAYGIVVNPVKSEEVVFKAGDRIVVLAED